MRANAIEAAQQCGILSLPEVAEPVAFGDGDRRCGRLLVFCDEDAEVKDPVAALGARAQAGAPLAVLIGPEGGFAEEERAALLKRPNVVRIALGPRILRADTAAVAALALVQAVLGDWREKRDRKRTPRLTGGGRSNCRPSRSDQPGATFRRGCRRTPGNATPPTRADYGHDNATQNATAQNARTGTAPDTYYANAVRPPDSRGK